MKKENAQLKNRILELERENFELKARIALLEKTNSELKPDFIKRTNTSIASLNKKARDKGLLKVIAEGIATLLRGGKELSH